MSKTEKDPIVTRSSGNVFADLGFADAEERKTKVRLAFASNQIVERRRFPKADATRQLGINQPKVSALANYRLEGFSVERLMHELARTTSDPAQTTPGPMTASDSRICPRLDTSVLTELYRSKT
jgi:predicted XRE-type DNA-binding protein